MNKTRPVLGELTGHTPDVTASIIGGYYLYPTMTAEHFQFPERKILESLEGKNPPNRTVIFQYILLFYFKYVITVTRFKYKKDIKISVRGFPGGAVVESLPAMQGRALVWEDPTCHGATGPVSHNC